MITVLILLAALAILGWGLYRALPYGKLGILAWLQSVVLMLPWLLFFGLTAFGLFLNLATVLFMLLISTGIYIFIGRQLRKAGANLPKTNQPVSLTETGSATSSDTASPSHSAVKGATSRPATYDAEAQSVKAETDAGTESTQPSESETRSTPSEGGATEPPKDKAEPKLDLPEIHPIPAEDLTAIQGIFGVDTFFSTETIPYQDGAIFKGNLRGDPAEVHHELTKALAERLSDRYRLFLVEGVEKRPVVIVLPSSNDPKPLSPLQKGIAVGLAIATLVTVFETCAFLLGFDLFETPNRWPEVAPIGISVLLILVAHEIGHWVLAKRNQVKLAWPFFIPAIQIGSFGAITRFTSLLPNRTVLFDVAIAGPAAGGLISLVMLIAGLVLSHPGSLFQIPVEFFQGSILVGTLAKVILGDALTTPIVDVHPLMIIGWLGLVITAINLMPAGQLDGGRIVQAIYGRTTARRTTFATLIILGLASLVNPLALYWAILILFLQRDLERPSLEELTEPDDARAAIGLLALFLMIATLLPLTPSLAGRLGIG
ncbi:MAG: site-2 protease family protein [Thainema sp.]